MSCVSNFTKFLLQLLLTQSSALGRRDIIFLLTSITHKNTASIQGENFPKILQIPHNCASLPVSKYSNRKYCSSEIKISVMLRVNIVNRIRMTGFRFQAGPRSPSHLYHPDHLCGQLIFLFSAYRKILSGSTAAEA